MRGNLWVGSSTQLQFRREVSSSYLVKLGKTPTVKVREENHHQFLGQMYATTEKYPFLQSVPNSEKSRQRL